jgi:hypothetical protein
MQNILVAQLEMGFSATMTEFLMMVSDGEAATT